MYMLITAATALPATGNTEKWVYAAVFIGAGVLVVAAAVAGVIGKKKKK